jgi:predicted oxidoreductase
MSVSRIAYGCSGLASWDKNPITADDIYKAARTVHTACEHGITLFDHADVYAYGKSEAVFGEVLQQSSGLRDKLVIQSKCGERLLEGKRSIAADLSREHIVSSVEGSLRRLNTDRLDILLLHVADALMQPEDVAEAFDDLNRSGKVRYFGVSNHNAAQIQVLNKYVRQPIAINQIQLSLSHAAPLADGMEFTLQLARFETRELAQMAIAGAGTIDYCRANDVQLQAWSPLRGVLASTNATPAVMRVAQAVADIAKSKETAPAAIALAWLLRHPAGIVPVFTSNTPEHIRANCAADGISLSRDEWYELFVAATQP